VVADGQISKKGSRKNTFGWARAEVLGALVNAVFLVAMCFTIFVEAIERLTHAHEVEHVDMLIYVGIAGLVINVVGLMLFSGHGHSHGTDHMELVVDSVTTDHQQTDGKLTAPCMPPLTDSTWLPEFLPGQWHKLGVEGMGTVDRGHMEYEAQV